MKYADDLSSIEEFDIEESRGYQESRDKIITQMLYDSLDLVVSSLSLTAREQRNVGVGLGIPNSTLTQDKSFLDLLIAYHLITFCSYEKEITIDSLAIQQYAKLSLHLSGLFYILTGVMNKISFQQNQYKKDYPKFIKGRLDNGKFIQQYSHYNTSNFIPCIEKIREYDNLENQAVCVSILLAIQKLKSIHSSTLKQYPKSEVVQVIDRIYTKLYKYLNNEFFYSSIKKSSQIVLYNDKSIVKQFVEKVKSKFAKNQIRNKFYLALLLWIEVFNKFDEEIANIDIDYLLPFSSDKDTTVDMLFEYWVLKQIITGLKERNDVNISELKPLAARENERENINKFVCEFEYSNHKYRLFFQHTDEICYDKNNKPRWTKSLFDAENIETPLGGRPDYSIYITSLTNVHRKTVIVDAKNKPGNKTGTEEVYKIIGYFDNYARKLKEDATGVLVFRKNKGQNDWKAKFDAIYKKKDGNNTAKIWKIGIDPLDNKADLLGQRKKIIDAVLSAL